MNFKINFGNMLLLFAGISASSILTYLETREPNAPYDPQAASSFWCDDRMVQSVANDAGMTLTAHNVNCDIIGNSTVIFVYLQLRKQTRSRVNLVLRYEGAEPEMSWVDHTHAIIKVSDVDRINKEVTELLGTHLAFDLKKSKFALEMER